MDTPCTYHTYTLHVHVPCTYLNALLAQLDRNGSGKVTLAEFQLVFASSVGDWRAAEAVVAEPVDAADREAYRALRMAQLQRRMELREADDETDFSREGPGRLVSDSRAEALAHKEAVRAAAAAAPGSPPVAADPAPERRPSTTKRQSAGQLNAERGISVRV